MLSLDEIRSEKIPHTSKGMPPGRDVAVGEIGDCGWNVLRQDVSFPVAILSEPQLRNNAAWMQTFVEETGVWLYPHGKTTMSPQLFDMQLRHGCRGLTAANPIQVQIYAEFGVRSIFLANQVTDTQGLHRLKSVLTQYDDLELFVIVDSVAGARLLSGVIGDDSVRGTVYPLIEYGFAGGRTGVRTIEAATHLATSMRDLKIPCRGLEAFEGILTNADEVSEFLRDVVGCYEALSNANLFASGTRYLSAGGSSFYDLVSKYFCAVTGECQVAIRSGCYITHDSGMYERFFSELVERGVIATGGRLQPCLHVWGQIQSQPDPGRAFANVGKRDISYDIEMPTARWWYRPGQHTTPIEIAGQVQVTGLNDQHAYLEFKDEVPLQIGDLVGFGVSHPCTTFDKWKYLFLVDDAFNVAGAVRTYF